METNKYLIFSR